jgi:outer membrane protein assembly factor BamB
MKHIKPISLLTLFSLLALSSHAQSQDWPRWRGPAGNGVTSETQWNPKALAGPPKILWKASVGTGFSSTSINRPHLITVGNENGKDTIVCLDPETGKKLWSYSYPCGLGSYPGPRATPTVDGGTVYSLSREGHLFALNVDTGKVRWAKHLVQDFGAEPPTWDFAGSPVVAGDRLILNAGEAGLALDKNTGARLWGSGRGPGGYATPVLATFAGKPAAVIFGQDTVYGVDLASGTQLWSFQWITPGSLVNAADPVAFDGKVFVSSAYGKGCALFDVSKGRPVEVWRNSLFEAHFSSFVLLDGYLYGIDGDARQPGAGTLRCVEALSGKEAWNARLGFGSLIAAGGRLVMLSSAGTITVAEATPAGYRELAKTSLPRDQYWTPPALTGGRLYVRNLRGDLFAIDVR